MSIVVVKSEAFVTRYALHLLVAPYSSFTVDVMHGGLLVATIFGTW